MLIALILAVIITTFTALEVPIVIDRLNDDMYGNITILDSPQLMQELKSVQEKGVILAIHGYKHEHYEDLTATQTKSYIERSILVFKTGGLKPKVFLSPYRGFNNLPPSIRDAINETGLSTSLPRRDDRTREIRESTWLWRNMTTFSDPRYQEAVENITITQPTYFLWHAQDWNQFSKQLLYNYLASTNKTNITIRVDDIDVNTNPTIVREISDTLQFKSVGTVALAVIPSGTWTGGNPSFFSVRVGSIFAIYWWFFIITMLFPLSFFVLWKVMAKWKGDGFGGNPPPLSHGNLDDSLKVSVIVPAYNEEETIDKCLSALLHQDYPGEIEIIVVNDGSVDQTADRASKYPVKLISLPSNGGKACALNRGIQEAHGEILVFSDSDSFVAPDAISSLVRNFNLHSEVQIVAGNIFIENDGRKTNFLQYFQIIEYWIEQEINRYLQALDGNVLVCPGPLFAVRRQVVETIQFDDNSIIEDADFTIQALKQSIKIIRDPDARVYTVAPRELNPWFKQRKRWWYGNLQLWKDHNSWAKKNSWMVMNYLSYVISVIALFMMILLPLLFLSYENVTTAMLRGLSYVAIPLITFYTFIGPFFIREMKKELLLLPYSVLYASLKVVIVSYLYIRYLLRIGVKITFGARTRLVI